MRFIPRGFRRRSWIACGPGLLRQEHPLAGDPTARAAGSAAPPAIVLQFDTSFDTSGFFAANPAAMTVLQQAGQILGSSLHDSLAAINPAGINSWTATFLNPGNPGLHGQVATECPRQHPDRVRGRGRPGGASVAWRAGERELVGDDCLEQPGGRPGPDQGPGHATHRCRALGRIVAFDTSTSWSFAGRAARPAREVDFLSVALHELGHVLGYGTSDSWSTFAGGRPHVPGPHAQAVFGGPAPIDPTLAHWAAGTTSAGAVTIRARPSPRGSAGSSPRSTGPAWPTSAGASTSSP